MLILGFGNKARHGKDTAVEAILDHYVQQNIALRTSYGPGAPQTKIYAFKYATALYQEVNEFLRRLQLGPNPLNWHGINSSGLQIIDGTTAIKIPEWVTPEPNPEVSELAPYGKHPKLLQWWGTDFRRKNFGENYWVDKMFASIPANLDIALISDVRFPNEADGIKQRGGYTINVTRLREDGTPYRSSDRPVDHPSETALDDYNWQFRLSNPEGHQAWLEEQAITLAEYLRGLHQ